MSNLYNVIGTNTPEHLLADPLNGLGLIPGLGRSPREGNGYHSSILACETPWTEVPGMLQSMGSQGVGHD